MKTLQTNFGSKPKHWAITALLFLVIAIWMGVILRASFIWSVPFNFQYLLHAHSHTAMLGWAYMVSIAVVLRQLKVDSTHRFWRFIFVGLCLSILGMSISFTLQGYGVLSIIFSTLHIFISYWIGVALLKKGVANNLSGRLFKSAVFWQMLSTMGIWFLVFTVVMFGKEHVFYKVAISIFLHFQVHGMFLLMTLGLLFQNLKAIKNQKLIFVLLNTGVVLTYFLNLYAHFNYSIFYWLNMLGVLSFLVVAVLMINNYHKLRLNSLLDKIIFVGFILLCIFQLSSLFSEFAQSVTFNRPLVLTYIHFILLGLFSIGMMKNVVSNHFHKHKKVLLVPFLLFFINYLITEILLAGQGMGWFGDVYLELFIASLIMAIGITSGVLIFYTQKIIQP